MEDRGKRRLILPLVPCLILALTAGVPFAHAEGKAVTQPEDALAARDTREAGERARRERVVSVMDDLLPLRPGEIRDFLDRQENAAAAASPDPASMRTRTVAISASPQSKPIELRLIPGYSSTLLFQDRTGAPWPVLSAVLGNAEAYSVTRPGLGDALERTFQGQVVSSQADREAGSLAHANMITVLPLEARASSNLVLTLEGASYPVLVQLVTGGDRGPDRVSDALTLICLDKPGPAAQPLEVGPEQNAVSRELLAFAQGLPPKDARRLRLSPELPGAEVWLYRNALYVRGPYQAVWPAWESEVRFEGLAVYRMPKTPALVLSVEGRARSCAVLEMKAQSGRGGPHE